MCLVVTFEDILLSDISEDCDGLIEDGIYFGIGFLVVVIKLDGERTRGNGNKSPL